MTLLLGTILYVSIAFLVYMFVKWLYGYWFIDESKLTEFEKVWDETTQV